MQGTIGSIAGSFLGNSNAWKNDRNDPYSRQAPYLAPIEPDKLEKLMKLKWWRKQLKKQMKRNDKKL